MKKILFVAIMLMKSFYGYSQTDPIRTEQNFIFQNINKTLIPTGYLNEYGPEVVDKTWLNGVLSDSNYIFDIDVFNLMYNDIEKSRINLAIPPMNPLDTAQVYTNLARYDAATILVLFSADYASLREDAIQQNLFTASGNQIYDVPGRNQSPYLLKHCFAAVPVLPESRFNNQIRIGYQPLFFGNTSRTISTVQVNFLDGSGYQNIFANGFTYLASKTFNDSTGYKKFSVKVTYTNGTTDECYTQQLVRVTSTSGQKNRFVPLTLQEFNTPNLRIPPTSYLNVNPYIPWFVSPGSPLQATQHFNQDMKIYIRYSKLRQGTALENKIVKPLIVVEGYDITDASPLLKPNNYGLNDLLEEWDNYKIRDVFDINKKLDEEAGYDLIFIDYYTMRSVIENADYLLQAIDSINSRKVNNADGIREQNVIMGISMGGLVSRYALAKRTKQTGTNNTETRQLITMDSPHQGANLPLGLQYFLYDLGEVKIVRSLKSSVDELKAFYNLNEQPATQQQLILRVTDGNGGMVTNAFLAPGGPYRTMVDYTAPYQFLAVSNGSQCGKQVMDAGALILQRSGNVAFANWLGGYLFRNKYRLTVQLNALPAYGSQAQICNVVMERNIRLFLGIIGTGWHTTSNTSPRISPANTIPWDGVPGGTRDVESGGSLSQSGTVPYIGNKNSFLGNLWRGVVGSLILNIDYNLTFPFAQKVFSFVPITSSLDVQNVTSTTFNQQFIFNINGSNGSRATKYIAQEFSNGSYNIFHTDFTPRNSEWIYKEMQNLPQTYDCDDYCDPNSSIIIGDNSFCNTSNSYSIPSLPPTSVVVWSATPSGIVTINSSGTSVTLSKQADGIITLTATVSNTCFGQSVISKPNILVGSPKPGQVTFSLIDPVMGKLYADIEPVENATSYYWYKNGVLNSAFNYGTSSHFLIPRNICDIEYDISVAAVNSCGVSPQSHANAYVPCDYYFVMSPNPATSTVNISLVENNFLKSSSNKTFTEIKIYDNKGNVKKIQSFPKVKTATFSVSGLQNGIYFVEISNGTFKEKKQLIIMK